LIGYFILFNVVVLPLLGWVLGCQWSNIMNKRFRVKAQAFVELALIMPVILLLIMGSLDLTRLFFTKVLLTNAAREGVSYLSYHKVDKDPVASCIETVNGVSTVIGVNKPYCGTTKAIRSELRDSGIVLANVTITIPTTGSYVCCTVGSAVEVKVQYTVTNLSIFRMFYGTVPLSSTVRMVVLQ
jgi:hypothetical protein